MSSSPLRVAELVSDGSRDKLLQALAALQGEFIQSGATQPPFDKLLAMLLEQSGSECGFLGEVDCAAGMPPRLRALLATPSSWLEALGGLACPGPSSSGPEDVSALIHRALSTGLPVRASAPTVASEGTHFPPPHQPLRSFLAVPILAGDERVGLVGLANRRADDDAGLLAFLQPLLKACGQFLLGWRQSQRRQQPQGTHDVDSTARRRGEERLRALVRAVPDLLFRMTSDGTYLDYNDGSPEPTAVPAEAFLGKNIRELPLPAAFIDKTLSHLQHVIREGTLDVFEYELEVGPGDLRHYEARLSRSGPDEVVCIVRNITDRKQAEARQAHLLQSEKMALLGQMAAGIAHEINNPVSYVMSNLGTLRQYLQELQPVLQAQRQLMEPGTAADVLSERLAKLRELWERERLDDVLQDMPELIQESQMGTHRIQNIVQSLRTFTRQDAGEPLLVDLNAELESSLRIVWAELRYKCEVQREYGTLPAVACFPNQLAQVFTNLLVNAAQAIETRGVIRVRTWQAREEAVVQISDTGQGMTPETIARLSTPFFTTKPRGQGTGLGLSISYGIIASHNGHIEVQSELGKGTTFTIHLPLPAS
jgi:PAS domain S-box-containing protein